MGTKEEGMIRDPSDGSIRKPAICWPTPKLEKPVLAVSGLQTCSSKAEYLARLEQSRDWLKNYHRPTSPNGR
jgi:hypothetical protein